MKKGFLIIFIISILFTLLFNYSLINIDVVSIHTDSNSLNGFIYSYKDNSTYIVTCFHGVCDDEEIFVENNKAELLNYDPIHDLALLKVNQKLRYTSIVKKIKKENIYIHHKEDNKLITNIGKMIDDNVLIHNSITYQNKQIDEDIYYLCIDIDSKKGYSGSPIYSNNNKMIGMIVMKDECYSYGLNIETIQEKVDCWIKGDCVHD